jgi:hypothetical protein
MDTIYFSLRGHSIWNEKFRVYLMKYELVGNEYTHHRIAYLKYITLRLN